MLAAQRMIPARGGFSDNFNRANSTTTLGSPWTYSSWHNSGASVWGIDTNQAYLVSAPTNPGIAVVDVGQSDGTLIWTMSVAGGSDAGPVFRFTDGNNFLWVSSNSLFRVQAGALTTLASSSHFLASGDVVQVVLAGSSITVTVNGGFFLGTVTATFNRTATKHGLSDSTAFSPTTRFDDFSFTP